MLNAPDTLLDFALLGFLVVIAVGALRNNNLFAVVMLFGIYSLASASLFVVLDAVDVAFTEAAVGAGIATILMLAALSVVGARSRPRRGINYPALAAVLSTGFVLGIAVLDLPEIGDPLAPAATHVAPEYLQESFERTHIPNIVTTVLASYRGYDTLGEVAVVFTAGVGVAGLLGARRRRRTPAAPGPVRGSQQSDEPEATGH